MHDFTVIKGKCSDFTVVPLKTDFEVRYERAREALCLWTLLQGMPAGDHARRERRVQYKNKFMALLSDSLQVNIEPLLTSNEQSYATKRENVLKLVREIYGNDAADFALKATERERAGN